MLLIEIITPETSNIMIWIASGLLSILIGLVGWLGNITYKNYLNITKAINSIYKLLSEIQISNKGYSTSIGYMDDSLKELWDKHSEDHKQIENINIDLDQNQENIKDIKEKIGEIIERDKLKNIDIEKRIRDIENTQNKCAKCREAAKL